MTIAARRQGRPRGPTLGFLVVMGALIAVCVAGWWYRTQQRPGADDGEAAALSQARPDGLNFAEPEVDLGVVKEKAQHVFRFENRSRSAVHILNVHSSCGCMAAALDRKSFLPGERGELAVTVHPRPDAIGPVRYTVDLVSAAGGQGSRTIRLVLRGLYQPDLVIPREVTMRLVVGQRASAYMDLVDYRSKPLEIKEIVPSSKGLCAAIAEHPRAYLPGWRYRIAVTHAASSPVPGHHAEALTILTSDPERPKIVVAVAIDCVRRVRVVPDRVYMKPVPGSGLRESKAFIDDIEGQSLEVAGIVPSHQAFKCHFERTNPAAGVLRILFTNNTHPLPSEPQSIRLLLRRPLEEEVCVTVLLAPP